VKWLEVDQVASAPNPNTVETPRGTFSAKVDPKGRLKIPAAFQEYFKAIGEEKFFVTTIDLRLLHIYPLRIWRENESVMDLPASSDAELDSAEHLKFIVNYYGGDASIDGEGRMLIPQELRKALGLGESQVWMLFDKGKIVGYNEAEFSKQFGAATSDLAAKVKTMKLKGFK
jgi:MraZ protein